MNSCVLMAKIVEDPQLRSTQDQVSVSSMLVEFPSTREEDPPGTLQVEGWGNLAEEIKNTYSIGDNIIIEGRLSMNLFDMPEGYKEKRAKLVASRIYPVGSSSNNISTSTTNKQSFQPSAEIPNNVVDFASTQQAQPVATPISTATAETTAPKSEDSEDWDEIPF